MTTEKDLQEPKLFKRRWLILFIYVIVCPTSGLQWTQYTMVSDVIAEYYQVSYEAVNWTNLIFLLTYAIFAFPCSYIIDKYGIRKSLLITTFVTCVATWIKASSTSSSSFWIIILGQVILSIPQACLQNLPPKIAADWFGPNEVSVACSIGTSGLQLACAIGFILPPVLVKLKTAEADLFITAIGLAIICTLALLLVLVFFPNKPPVPPSHSAMEKNCQIEYKQSMKQLLNNTPFVLSVMGAGLNLAAFCVLQPLLNQIILRYYPDGSEDAGWMGLLIVIMGLLGSIGAGYLLDKFQLYRMVSLIVDIFIVLASIAFAFTLSLHIVFPYILCTLVGSLMLVKWVVTYEISIETSYPEPEALVVGLINIIGQSLGIVFTYTYSFIFYEFNDFWANIFLSVICTLSFLFTLCSKFKLKRYLVNVKSSDKVLEEENPLKTTAQ